MNKNSSILKQALRLLALLVVVSGSALSALAQSVRAHGVVVDVEGSPLPGVTVRVTDKTGQGTITDMDGNFSIQVEKSDRLTFTYVGFVDQTIAVADQTFPLRLVLHEDSELLDEVVVIGYAKGSKSTISGAVSKLGSGDLNAGMVVNPLQAISGKIAGVNVRKVGGDPTSKASIRIRGTTSLSGGNDPLVVIDGIFGDLALLNSIAETDIENISILKDASETAQYGSRGAAGVIVVTTKKGKGKGFSLSYDGQYGVEVPYKTIQLMDAAAYRKVVADKGYTNALDAGATTDFMGEMLQTGFTQNHKVSFGGGVADSNFRASLGVVDQKGIIKTNGMQLYTAKIDVSQRLFDNKLTFDAGIFGSKRHNRYVNDYQKTFYSAASSNPTLPAARNEDGSWPEDPNANEIDNPLGRLTIKDREEEALLTANGRIVWKIIPELSLQFFGSYTYSNKENSKYVPNDIKAGIREGRGHAYRGTDRGDAMMGNVTLNYTKDWGMHRLDALAVAEGQQYAYHGYKANVRGFDTNYFTYDNLKAGAIVKYGDNESYRNQYILNSYLVRLNYIYGQKYIATVNLRADGSSKLGANNKWGFFPSASIAWVISREDFLKDVTLIDELKIRTGYGVTGNQDAIEAYNSLLLMGPNGITSLNGSPTVTFGYNRNANPELRWETKKMLDAGVDLSIDKGRFTATLDYYYSKTSNLLYNYNVPVPPFVHPTLLANLGEMENTGIELELGYSPIRTEDMDLTFSANVTYQRNKLLSLSGTYMGQDLSASKYMRLGSINGAGFIGGNNGVVYQLVGQPLGVFYLPKSNGLKDDGHGNYSYDIVDTDGKEGIDIADGKDRYIAGQAMPKVFVGGNISFRYKDFDLQLQTSGAFGHKIYNGTTLSYMNMNTFPTYNVLPEAPEKNIRDNTVTDYWLERGDYLNIDYLSLGYNISPHFSKGTIQKVRLSASVNNLHTFTAYTGLSPMINSSTVGEDLGIDDKRFYPLSRTFTLGLNVTF